MPDSLFEKLKRSTRLPSPPGTALQVLRLCQQDDVSIAELADVLAADPALSLRLLKYANSAIVGVAKQVTSIRDAVMLLGIRSVRLMALSFSLISSNDTRLCPGFEYGRFWSHSVACGVAARELAKRKRIVSGEEAFVAGVLARIGKLALAVCLPQEYAVILRNSGGTLCDARAFEVARFGSSSEELGADLMIEWGIPEQLADAVRHQSDASQLEGNPQQVHLGAILRAAALIANVICHARPEEVLEEDWASVVTSEFFEGNADEAEATLENIRTEFTDMAGMLKLDLDTAPNAEEIQAEAGEVLGELSLAAQLQSEAVEKDNRVLQQKAWTDGLTGINNRAAFDKHLTQVWDEALIKKKPIALVLIDVDHFKKFNDTYGHRTGDAVLKSVAKCVASSVRAVDFPARYGGEEFAVILTNVDRIMAASLCVKIRKVIESCVVEFEGRMHKVTASIGAALLPDPGPPYTPHMLIEAADQQLYKSKEKGRNACSMKQLQPTPELVQAS